jgi:hypothetical protein
MLARADGCGELLDFNEVQRRLQLGTRVAIGVQEIPVANVIGSVSRVSEFDGCFRPRSEHLRKKLRDIREAKPDAANDPILVYGVDHAYFVVDGHKRMALAVEEGREFIDASVERWPSRFHLERGVTLDEVRATELERRFRQTTGLDVAAPDARFPLSDPGAYIDLLESIKAHAYDLSREAGSVLPPAEAARHWYDTVYLPVLRAGHESGIDRVVSSCSDAEIFLLLRAGVGLGEMEPGWQMPSWFQEHAEGRKRAAEPHGVPAVLQRVTRRRQRRPRVLEAGDIDDATTPRADSDSVVQRPLRRAEPTPPRDGQ